MIGHSIGEYVAACLAGVFDVEDALKLVALRGRLMGEQPHGSMIAVPLSEADVQSYMNDRVALAAVNAPTLCVLSGPTEDIEKISGHLAARGLHCRPLHTSHAFHSSMMDAAVAPFVQAVQLVTRNVPQLAYLSNLTGTWIRPEDATSAEYWGKHLRHAVRFSEAIGELLRVPHIAMLEVGPGAALTSTARMQVRADHDAVILSSVRPPQQTTPDAEYAL